MTHVLLGEWGFLDNLADTSGNGLTASANFTPTFIDGPVAGTRAIRYSATSQTVTYGRTGLEPAAAAGGIITMGWAKLFGGHGNFTDIIHKTRAFDSTKHSIDLHNGAMFWMSRWRDQLVFDDSGANPLTDLGWHHMCNVDSDDRRAWFFDGTLVSQTARSGSSPVSWEDFPWVSGKDANMANTDSHVNVAFTGIRIFSGTMSNSEVVAWKDTPILAGRSGKPKVWNGTSWAAKPAKFWDGSAWVTKPMLGFDGTDWIPSK